MSRARWIPLVLIVVLACRERSPASGVIQAGSAQSAPESYGLGTAVSAAELAAIDIDVAPSGDGLPAGRGTPAEGALVFARKCAVCHGAAGEGQGPYPRLIGPEPRDSFPFGRDPKLVKTIGNYWPYATTIYDYVHRAMPFTAPGSLSANEVYGLTAFLLARNAIIGPNDTLDARRLPTIRMPARNRFVRDDRKGGAGFR